MSAKKMLVLAAQKLIYIFLIIWVGGLAPLIYFENYSSHREVQRVQVSLLKEPGGGRLPAAFRQMWAQQVGQQPARGLNAQSQWITRNISLPGTNSSVIILHDGYLLSAARIATLFDAPLAGSVSEIQLMGQSVWLPPPEKPPPFPVASC